MGASRDWSPAQALAAQEQFVAAGGRSADPAGPLSQWAALQQLERLEGEFRAGDKSALLAAVAECARTALAMPDWLITGFLAAYREGIHHRAASWDEVFGELVPKGGRRRLEALRAARETSVLVYHDVQRRHAAGEPLDDLLFDKVGAAHGIGRTLVKQYYVDWKRRLRRPAP